MNSIINLTNAQITEFQKHVLSQGELLYREMPWRNDTNPYFVLLSEIMLQQTQVSRVLQKFNEFTSVFPTIQSLADADFQEVLALWTGLGYNRRAKFLHQTAKQIIENGTFPTLQSELEKCPGIGENTAASILVYAFNQPLVFLETNIRTVLIYNFFHDSQEKIAEPILKDLAFQTLFRENPRKWYWAMMDYGTELKKTVGNFNRMSKMHTMQSKFEGSFRQKRAATLRFLLHNGPTTMNELSEKQGVDISTMQQILDSLQKDALVSKQKEYYLITA